MTPAARPVAAPAVADPVESALGLRDFEALARRRLERAHYDYVAGGAHDELTLRANEDAFGRLHLLPRVFRGGGEPDTVLDLFGFGSSMPVLLSPTAFHRLADPEGERATARAAARAGVVMVLSMAATVPVGEVAAAAREVAGDQAALWFQLYPQPEPEVTDALLDRATDAGCRALVVTADSPVFGFHERDRRNGFVDLPDHLACENMRDLPGSPPGGVRPIAMSPWIGWRDLARLRARTTLPVILKGVLHPEDVRIALEHGVDGLLLSNHGGRQLDTVPASIDLLPEVVAAVGGRVPVLLDGGVRRGTDVVKALALGAAAVGIGRPAWWGLAAAGERGVAGVLRLLRDEVERAMTLCGAARLTDLTPDLVRADAAGGGGAR